MIAANTLFPVISNYRPAQRFGWRDGEPIMQAQALADIQHLAKQLETGTNYLNLCEDRYLFTIAFAAVGIVQGINLLPQSRSAGILNTLCEHYPHTQTLDNDCVIECLGQRARPQISTVPSIDARNLAAIVFTSGSTGRPNPQPKHWRDLYTCTTLCQRRFFTGQAEYNIVTTVPPQHMYGLETSVLTVLHAGFAAHSTRCFMPWDIARALAQMPEPRVLITTPVHMRACIEADVDMPSLHSVICATAPLSSKLAQAAEANWDTEVYEIYGCTEAGSLASRRTTVNDIWTLYDGMRLQQQGESLFVYGSQLPHAVPMNDNLKLLDERCFLLLGRSADMIKLAGKRLSLGDLTQQLLAIDGVQDAIAFMPGDANPLSDNDEKRPVALVVAPTMRARDIAIRLACQIDPVFVPRPLLLVERLPRNAMGKLPHSDLELLLEHARNQQLPLT